MTRRPDELRSRPGIIWSATDLVREAGRTKKTRSVCNRAFRHRCLRRIPGCRFREGNRSKFNAGIVAAIRCADLGAGSPQGGTFAQLSARLQLRYPAGCVRRFCVTLPSKKSNKSSHRMTDLPHITNSNHGSAAGHRWI